MNRIMKKAASILLAITMIFAVPACLGLSTVSHAAEAASAVWPTDKAFQKITTYFDAQRNVSDASGYHNGIDIEADYGTSIYAVRPGTCISADWKDAYGNMIILYHADLGVYTFYAHCASVSIAAGAEVSGGDVIGQVGSTGQSSGNHLHFGICDALLNGWPRTTYYDPLTYFTYDGTAIANPNPVSPSAEEPACECTEDYAGIYTTKGVVTFLYIRAGHSADTSALGQIPAGSEVKVTKGDGKWAHVEFNGIKGYSSMDYLEKVRDFESGMTISGETAPKDTLTVGSPFKVKGVISSNLPIKKVSGGVYSKDGKTAVVTAEAAPNAASYDLSTEFDKQITFNKLAEGSYTYRIEAEDSSGKSYKLVESSFTVGKKPVSSGDLNGDDKVTISDAVMMQNYLLGGTSITKEQYEAADMNSDKSVDTFDMIVMRKKIVENSGTATW